VATDPHGQRGHSGGRESAVDKVWTILATLFLATAALVLRAKFGSEKFP
jgi:hypothetical protein